MAIFRYLIRYSSNSDTTMLKILLIDEHHIVREGLKQLLEKCTDILVSKEVDSAKDVLGQIRKEEFDLIVLNSISAAMSDIEIIKQVKSLRPKMPILVLSASSDAQYCEKSLKAGASGFLTKQSGTEELVQAIRTITRGGRYICPAIMDDMTGIILDGKKSLSDTLSDREYEVMLAITSGKRIKQIAKELSLSIKTISTYHSRILQKLKFQSDAEMIRFAIEQGMIKDGIATRGNLVLAELGFKTGSAMNAIKEIWQLRKDVILILIVASIISYVFLSFIVSALF